MALIQSRFIYYAIFPAAQRQEICLKFAIRTLSWQSCQSWQTTWYEGGELNGTGRGTRSYRKQEQPKHGEGVAKTELKKKTGANKWKYIYIRIYFVWAPKILCNKNANDARTSADSFRLSLDSGHNLCSYAYLLFALDAGMVDWGGWWMEDGRSWEVEHLLPETASVDFANALKPIPFHCLPASQMIYWPARQAPDYHFRWCQQLPEICANLSMIPKCLSSVCLGPANDSN